MEPRVDIILVNYNGFEDTVECVKSLQKITYKNYRVTVVENGSSQKPTPEQEFFLQDNTHYIVSKENTGFSGGNNIGIQAALAAGTDYILLLNNDTTVESDFLSIMVDTAEKNPEAGIIGGEIRFYKEPDKLWFGGGFFNEKTGCGHHIGYNTPALDTLAEVKEITFMTGCLMLIPVAVIDKVGMLSEEYFLYSEDTDYCCKVMRAGYKILYCNGARIYHKVSASTGKNSDFQTYYMVRNNLIMIRKFVKHPVRTHINRAFYYSKEVVRGRKNIKPVLKAYFDFFRRQTGRVN